MSNQLLRTGRNKLTRYGNRSNRGCLAGNRSQNKMKVLIFIFFQGMFCKQMPYTYLCSLGYLFI